MKPLRKTESFGTGCVLQLLACVVVIACVPFGLAGWAIGGLIALVLFVAGSEASKKWVCPVCFNRVDNARVTLCEACVYKGRV